jgi:hypothetical protein
VPGSFQRAESLHDRRDQCSFAVANPRSVGSTNRSLNCVTHTAAVIRLITRQVAFSLEAVVIFRRSGRQNRSELRRFPLGCRSHLRPDAGHRRESVRHSCDQILTTAFVSEAVHSPNGAAKSSNFVLLTRFCKAVTRLEWRLSFCAGRTPVSPEVPVKAFH